jgi:hypothetical protein
VEEEGGGGREKEIGLETGVEVSVSLAEEESVLIWRVVLTEASAGGAEVAVLVACGFTFKATILWADGQGVRGSREKGEIKSREREKEEERFTCSPTALSKLASPWFLSSASLEAFEKDCSTASLISWKSAKDFLRVFLLRVDPGTPPPPPVPPPDPFIPISVPSPGPVAPAFVSVAWSSELRTSPLTCRPTWQGLRLFNSTIVPAIVLVNFSALSLDSKYIPYLLPTWSSNWRETD